MKTLHGPFHSCGFAFKSQQIHRQGRPKIIDKHKGNLPTSSSSTSNKLLSKSRSLFVGLTVRSTTSEVFYKNVCRLSINKLLSMTTQIGNKYCNFNNRNPHSPLKFQIKEVFSKKKPIEVKYKDFYHL